MLKMEPIENSNEIPTINYEIQSENEKSKVIFDDQVYIISTIRAKRFAIHKCKKLRRMAKNMQKMLLVKKEENNENPLFGSQEFNDKLFNKKYKYESRHNHATNRRRDDKGRFISRQQREQEQLNGTPDSPILIQDEFSLQQELAPTIHEFVEQYDNQGQREDVQEQVHETPWLEKRVMSTPYVQKEQISHLQLFTPVMQFNEGEQNQLVNMLPLLPEAMEMQDEDNNEYNEQQQYQQQLQPVEGNHILLIDLLGQKVKKEETDTYEEPVNYFNYLKLEPEEVANVNWDHQAGQQQSSNFY